MQDITEALIMEGKIKDEVMMNLRAHHKAYIVNKGKKEASLTVSDQLIGFGKGGFKLVKGDASEHQVVFKLDGPDTPVIFNNVRTSLQKVLLAQREKDPDVKVCYHKLHWDEADPKLFTITQTHMISFSPNKDAKEIVASNLATQEPVSFWNNEVTQVLWSVRWAQKGLMPVKPAVFLKGELNLMFEQACSVTAAPAAAAGSS